MRYSVSRREVVRLWLAQSQPYARSGDQAMSFSELVLYAGDSSMTHPSADERPVPVARLLTIRWGDGSKDRLVVFVAASLPAPCGVFGTAAQREDHTASEARRGINSTAWRYVEEERLYGDREHKVAAWFHVVNVISTSPTQHRDDYQQRLLDWQLETYRQSQEFGSDGYTSNWRATEETLLRHEAHRFDRFFRLSERPPVTPELVRHVYYDACARSLRAQLVEAERALAAHEEPPPAAPVVTRRAQRRLLSLREEPNDQNEKTT